MNKIIRVIGTLILVILIWSVPVLFGCSLALPWALYVRFLLGIGTIGEIAVGGILIYFKTDDP